ncbi:MAG: type II methionyl aminopeptidase [Candidatus Nezhaarchaeota archaeon]|nr:type II methionyl aminopeptidase [Candidatus Nezhaarchaeota archaeon]
MDEYEVKCYLRAGRAAAKALEEVCHRVHEGALIKELCELAEATVRKEGAYPAFPCNVSINSTAAHYTALADDEEVVPKGAVVKVDVGAHVEGYIGDVAATVSLNPEAEPLLRAAQEALNRALELMKPGVPLSRVGWAIEATIKSYGLKPIQNLTGHGLSRYSLHTGVAVPNVRQAGGVVEDGGAYAIEPFATNGEGYVIDSEKITIFRYSRAGKVKGERARSFLEEVQSRFKTLPFTERWLINKWKLGEVRKLLSLLTQQGLLHAYPVLVERGGGVVSQFEHTVIVVEGRSVVTTLYE